MIIAVDGPAASGKGTISKRLAKHYGLRHLDTGRTYRAVAKAMMEAGTPFDDVAGAIKVARELDFGSLSDPSLVAPEYGEGASRIAVLADLRVVLVARQKAFAQNADPGAVLDGRDIGTVVCPEAALKLYVTASVEERARRRSLEVYGVETGERYDALLSSLRVRDERDASRAASPLRPAEDAHIIDTTRMTIDEAVNAASRLVEVRLTA
ncbi:MAG: (d)CMP kinase [Pseudomonadota bacterium]